MVVISVSLSGQELREFDAIVEKMGYSSRSDAVREAFHSFVSQNRWALDDNRSSNLLVSLIYGDSKAHKVLDIVHGFTDSIYSSSHTHVDHKCVDQLVMKGGQDELKAFMKALAGIKDVRVKQTLL